MFLGQYRHTIDEKGRLTIPARFRELLENGAYITQGFEKNLMVLTSHGFESMTRQVNRSSITDPTARALKRLLFSTADRISTDKNGRILIPQFLRESNQLDGEAVLVGVGDYFEIWTPEAWEQQLANLQDTEANEQRFVGLDLSTSL
ncbi:division/cell wall cluster transcriptional repressor MraZ [bacterium]|nr:division/cell wall cluster transcriptional repressor MraZ [bacterium]MCB2179351.1 division/cell wall cluster transcriptional repressor MraZ [bacterium]